MDTASHLRKNIFILTAKHQIFGNSTVFCVSSVFCKKKLSVLCYLWVRKHRNLYFDSCLFCKNDSVLCLLSVTILRTLCGVSCLFCTRYSVLGFLSVSYQDLLVVFSVYFVQGTLVVFSVYFVQGTLSCVSCLFCARNS